MVDLIPLWINCIESKFQIKLYKGIHRVSTSYALVKFGILKMIKSITNPNTGNPDPNSSKPGTHQTNII